MARNSFELQVEGQCLQAGWKPLLITKKLKGSDGMIITDHDVVVYKATETRVVILEIQCKDETASKSFRYGEIEGRPTTTRWGYFSTNELDKLPIFREVETTELPVFHIWEYFSHSEGKYVNMLERPTKNPLTQLYFCCVDTLTQLTQSESAHLKGLKGKEIILIPLIIYKSLRGNYVPLRLPFTKKFALMIGKYLHPFYNIPASSFNTSGEFPLILLKESALSPLLSQFDTYTTQLFVHNIE